MFSFLCPSVFASSVATPPLSLVLILFGTIPAHGQNPAPRSATATRQVEASRRAQERVVVQRSPAVLESYRAQMMTIMANYYEIGRLNTALGRLHPSAPAAPADQLAEPPAVRALGLMQEASNADLNLLMEYVPDLQPLLSSTDLLRVLVQAEVDAQRESVGSGTGGGGSGTGGGRLRKRWGGITRLPQRELLQPMWLRASVHHRVAGFVRDPQGRRDGA